MKSRKGVVVYRGKVREKREKCVCERAKEPCQVKEGVIVVSHERCRKKSEGESQGKKGASPGIEPGPLAPEANIIPLNYEAVQS